MNVDVNNLRKSFPCANGKRLDVLDGITFHIPHGTIVGLLGPSGAGKTTLLKILAGLEPADGGEIRFAPKSSTVVPIVWQDYRLLPWLTAFENIAFPLKLRGLSEDEISRTVGGLLRELGLSDFANYLPWQLSGGMAQRVAVGRAVSAGGDLLLFDEPFASLDDPTKQDLMTVLLALKSERRLTVVFVTHNLRDVVEFADRIIVLGPRPSRVIEEVVPSSREMVRTDLELRLLSLLRNPRMDDRDQA